MNGAGTTAWLHVMEGILTIGEIAGAFWIFHGVLGERAAARGRAAVLFIGAVAMAGLTIYQRTLVGMYSRAYLIFCIVCCSLIGVCAYRGGGYGKGGIAIVIAAYFESVYCLDIGLYVAMGSFVPERVLYGGYDIQRNLTVERILLLGVSRLAMAALLWLLRKHGRKVRYFLRWSGRWCALLPAVEHGVLLYCDIAVTRSYREEGIERGMRIFGAVPFLAVLAILLALLWRYKSMYRVLSDRNQEYLHKWECSWQDVRERERIYHDAKNHLVIVGKMLKEGRAGDAQAYIEKLAAPIAREDAREWLGHPMLDYLLESKRAEAEQAGIVVTCEVEKVPVSFETEALTDWGALLGNLWDNAIEGCARAEGERWIRFSVAVKGNGVRIDIGNACRPGLDIRKLRTEKAEKKGHGIGLRSIEYVVDKYDGEIRYSCEDDTFEVLITLLV